MADIGHGAAFLIGDGASPEAFTELTKLTSVAPPSLSRASVDSTTHDSTDRYQEFIPGLRDAGEVPIQLEYSDAAYTTLLAKYNANTVTNYQVAANDGAEWEWAGFITSLETETPIDDRMVINVTFKVSGKPTFTEGA